MTHNRPPANARTTSPAAPNITAAPAHQARSAGSTRSIVQQNTIHRTPVTSIADHAHAGEPSADRALCGGMPSVEVMGTVMESLPVSPTVHRS
jgi:hypothetical protein